MDRELGLAGVATESQALSGWDWPSSPVQRGTQASSGVASTICWFTLVARVFSAALLSRGCAQVSCGGELESTSRMVPLTTRAATSPALNDQR